MCCQESNSSAPTSELFLRRRILLVDCDVELVVEKAIIDDSMVTHTKLLVNKRFASDEEIPGMMLNAVFKCHAAP